MAHNINRNQLTGEDAFFSVKEKAWHGLGQIVEEYPTSEEAIKFAGLDFTVEKQTLYTANPLDTAAQIEVPEYFANVRTDTGQPLGVVGSKYHIVQNAAAFTFFDSIVGDKTGILYETAGALGNGERIFITAKLPNYIEVSRKDLIEQYIFLTTSHDGSGSITAAFTPVRIVCNNTLNAALRNCSNSINIRHTASANEKLVQAHEILGISNKMSDQLETIFKKWSRQAVTDREVKKLIQLAMAPNPEVFQAVATGKRNFEFSRQFEEVSTKVFDYAMTSETQQMTTTAGTYVWSLQRYYRVLPKRSRLQNRRQ